MLPVNTKYQFPESPSALPSVSRHMITMLEKDQNLTIREKIDLLLILLRQKWVTEIGLKNNLTYIKKVDLYHNFLSSIGLVYAKNYYNHSQKGKIEWV